VVGLEDGPIDEQHDAGGEEHTESCAARPSRAPALRHRGQDRTGHRSRPAGDGEVAAASRCAS
jgi:hypothetical protein